MDINKFIMSIDNDLYNKIRQSKGDAECRRYLLEHAMNKFDVCTVADSLCNHYFIQKDTNWKSCIHCGKLEPLGGVNGL